MALSFQVMFDGFDEGSQERGGQKIETRITAGLMEEMESVMLSSRDAQMCGTLPGS